MGSLLTQTFRGRNIDISLHDIDKQGDNRVSPQPNANDQRSEYLAQGTNQAQNHGAAASADGLKIKERQIIARQGGYNKAAFGFYGTANKFGLKVAKEGYDVLTATDDQLVFNSEQNTFKIVKSVPISLTMSYNNASPLTWYATASIPHGLSYAPSYSAYHTIPSAIASGGSLTATNLPNPALVFGSSGTTLRIFALATVNVGSTNVTLSVQLDGSWSNATYSFSANVYLLQETQ